MLTGVAWCQIQLLYGFLWSASRGDSINLQFAPLQQLRSPIPLVVSPELYFLWFFARVCLIVVSNCMWLTVAIQDLAAFEALYHPTHVANIHKRHERPAICIGTRRWYEYWIASQAKLQKPIFHRGHV